MTDTEHRPDSKLPALLITRNLPPLVGGMERLVWHIADALARDYRLHVIGPAGCAKHLPQSTTVREVPIKPLWRFLLKIKWHAFWYAIRHRPHLLIRPSEV